MKRGTKVRAGGGHCYPYQPGFLRPTRAARPTFAGTYDELSDW